MSLRVSLCGALILFATLDAKSWDGVDSSSGVGVSIDKGNLVRRGNDIEIYDYDEGEYKNVTVERIRRVGDDVEVEVYDYDTGESRTLVMDGD